MPQKRFKLQQILILSFMFMGVVLTIVVSLVAINQKQNVETPAWDGCHCQDGLYQGDYCPPYLLGQVCEK